MSVKMEVEGLAELEKQLSNLEHVAQKRVLRKTARESAKPIEKAMHQKVQSAGHIDTGLLNESIKTRVTMPRRKSWADVVASIGIFKLNPLMRKAGLDPKKDMPPTVYGWWLEHGVQPHYTGSGSNVSSGSDKKTGLKHPGIPAKPFIRPAFDQQLKSTTNIQKNILSAEIDKVIQKGR